MASKCPDVDAARRQAIVNASRVVIAAPYEDEPQTKGGTWLTVTMAIRATRRGTLGHLFVVGRGGDMLDWSTWKL